MLNKVCGYMHMQRLILNKWYNDRSLSVFASLTHEMKWIMYVCIWKSRVVNNENVCIYIFWISLWLKWMFAFSHPFHCKYSPSSQFFVCVCVATTLFHSIFAAFPCVGSCSCSYCICLLSISMIILMWLFCFIVCSYWAFIMMVLCNSY